MLLVYENLWAMPFVAAAVGVRLAADRRARIAAHRLAAAVDDPEARPARASAEHEETPCLDLRGIARSRVDG